MYILAIETTGAYASVALLKAEQMKGTGRPDLVETAAGHPGNTEGGGNAEGFGDSGNTEGCENAEGLGDAGEILGVIHGNDRFSHLQNLTPQIQQILEESKLSIGDMTAVAVSHGPGSFTGIRIGVSTARALAQVLDIPCIAVSSLEALALRAKEKPRVFAEDRIEDQEAIRPEDQKAVRTGDQEVVRPADQEAVQPTGQEAVQLPVRSADQPTEGRPASPILICPILDARRKQVYGAAYELADGVPVCRIEPESCLMTEFLEKLDQDTAGASSSAAAGASAVAGASAGTGASVPRRILFLGDGIDTCGDIIEAWSRERPAFAVGYAPEEIRYQDAAAVARRGLQLYREGRTCGYMQLQPEYLRMAEAEKKLRERQAAETKKPEDSR